MLEPTQLHEYQRQAIMHQLQHDDSMLWLGMGLGKSIITLTTIVDRIRAGIVKKTLIVAPLRVIQSVWAQEAQKWNHTRHLNFTIVHGTKVARTRLLFERSDVYLINYENLSWLVETLNKYFISKGEPVPFEMVVFDEISKMKNSTSMRVAGGKRDLIDDKGNEYSIKIQGWRSIVDQFKFRTGLTGTPASNGVIDLHGQYLSIDGGHRLGTHITHFRDSFFKSDYMGWSYEPTKLGTKLIEESIADITLKMDSNDYLDMPEVVVTDIMIDLPTKARKAYEEIEKEMFSKLDNGSELEVFSKSSISNKCLQIANGAAYLPESTEFEVVHKAKLEALDSVLEEAAGSPVLCAYTFKSDAARIMKHFKKYKPVNLTATSVVHTVSVLDKWKQGEIKLLLGHPASIGHGVDGLQDRGHIVVWFGLNWSLELYDQLNARINRQGQTKTVSIIRILANDTVDLAVSDALAHKFSNQEGLKQAIQRYRDRALNFY